MRITLSAACTFFLLFLAKVANADPFLVTSNADSGPGTLREAITTANGNGIIIYDTILFNIPDVSRDGRTITLLSPLPALSSNLVIDGTSQGGTAFGVSHAKVMLFINQYQPARFSFFYLDGISDVHIYGLFLFNEKITIFGGGPRVDGIEFKRSQNIFIGKAGKGNYFRGLTNAILSLTDYNSTDISDHLTIQANVFNNDENGVPSISYLNSFIDPMDHAVNLYNTRNVLIGGDNPADGNFSNARNMVINSIFQNGNGYLHIKNNKLNINSDGALTPTSSNPRLTIQLGSTNFGTAHHTDYDVLIENNIIHGNVTLSQISKYFIIQNNLIFDHMTVLPQGDYRIQLLGCSNGGRVGGDLPGQSNTIYSTRAHFGNYSWQLEQGSILLNGSPKVSILKNSMHCNDDYFSSISYGAYQPGFTVPYVKVETCVPGFTSGKATPNTRIDLYLDDECSACEGKVYLGQTTSKPDSSWSFAGNFNGTIVATSTNSETTTSEFSQPEVNLSNVVKMEPSCGLNNGSIKGILLSGTWDNVEWHSIFNRDGYYIDSIISTRVDLVDIGAGNYYFVSKFKETCRSVACHFKLYNFTPAIVETNANKVNPSCGQFNGTVYGIGVTAGDYATYNWVNEQGTVVATGNASAVASLENIGAGRYRLIVTDDRTACSDTSNWYTLLNQTGPLLNTGNIQVKPATCSKNNGSITNVVASNYNGTPYIEWTDAENNIVGHALNLLNQAPGKYKLKFKDEGSCDTIITPYYIIPNEGTISINVNDTAIAPAGCTVNNGSITNIHVTGADSWQWKNLATNTNAGNSINITGLSPGNYQLTVSNAFGCTLSSPVIAVPQVSFASIIPQNVTINNGSCGENNGSLKIDGFSNAAALVSYHWLNTATNQIIGTKLSLAGLGAGTYSFVATDTNGCQQTIFTQPIVVNPKPAFNTGAAVLTDDQCSLQKGSVTGIKTTGLQGPTTYTWTNASNFVVGTSPDLSNIGTGDYRLTVNDQGNCIIQSGLFIIKNFDNAGIAPLYDELMIQRNTPATLIVKNFRNGTYVLYSDAAGTQILQQNTTGIFTTAILNNDIDFYVQHTEGSCKSPLVKIKITVVDNSLFAIPTAFTPNQDGLNDKLALKVIGYIEVEYFRIYNRNGELVFSTNVVNTGWDGTLKGVKQPSGAYVWMAKGKDISGRTITDKGNIVLIR